MPTRVEVLRVRVHAAIDARTAAHQALADANRQLSGLVGEIDATEAEDAQERGELRALREAAMQPLEGR